MEKMFMGKKVATDKPLKHFTATITLTVEGYAPDEEEFESNCHLAVNDYTAVGDEMNYIDNAVFVVDDSVDDIKEAE